MWNEANMIAGSCAIVYYNASFAWLGAVTLQPAYYGICGTNTSGIAGVDPSGSTADGGVVTFTVPNNADIAYVRFSMSCTATNGSDLADIIVTVNEEITD